MDKSPSRKDIMYEEVKDAWRNDFLGARDFQRSKLGYIFGISFFTNLIRRSASRAKGSYGNISYMMKATFGKGQDIEGPSLDASAHSDGALKFKNSQSFYGTSESDIKTIALNTYKSFYLYLILFIAVVCVGIVTMGNTFGLYYLSWIRPLFILIPMPLLLSLMLRSGYTNWIVRRRSMDSLKSYLKSGDWFPEKPGTGPSNNRARNSVAAVAIVTLLVGLATVSMNSPVLADETPSVESVFTDAPDSDLFVRLLSYIVPGVGPVPDHPLVFDGNNESVAGFAALSAGMATFSGILLFVASLMLSWHVVSGIVASAYEGKVLGQKWHQIWAPIRVSLGIGMLAPISGGFCAAQILVLYLAVWGGNIANEIWSVYVDHLVGQNQIGTTSSGSDDIETEVNYIASLSSSAHVVQKIAEKELCWHALDKYVTDNNIDRDTGIIKRGWLSRTWNNVFSTPNVTRGPVEMKNEYFTFDALGRQIGDRLTGKSTPLSSRTQVSVLDYGEVCGSITLQTLVHLTGNYSPEDRPRLTFDAHRRKAFVAARGKIVEAAKNMVATYAGDSPEERGFVGNTEVTVEFGKALSEAMSAYDAEMLQAARKLMSDSNSEGGKDILNLIKDNAKAEGWASSGYFYLTVSRLHGAIYAKASEIPEISPILVDPRMAEGIVSALYGEEQRSGLLADFQKWWTRNFVQEIKNDNRAKAAAAGWNLDSDNESSIFMEALDAIVPFNDLQDAVRGFDLDPIDPMSSMIHFGHKILNVVILILATFVAVVALGSVAGAAAGTAVGGPVGAVGGFLLGGALKGIAKAAAPLFWVIIVGLFVVGIVHAYLLPMMPYMIVMFFVLSMIILVIEAMVAAPLWAFFHVRMDGNELVDQMQRPGYMIAFNLMLRPALMVLALIMSMALFGAMAWFMNNTFYVAVESATAGHSTGLIGYVVMLGILTYLHYQIAVRSFEVMTKLPDRVARWFGQGGENFGEDGDNRQASALILGQVQQAAKPAILATGIGAMRGGPNEGDGDGNSGEAGRGNAATKMAKAAATAAGGPGAGAAVNAGTEAAKQSGGSSGKLQEPKSE